MENTQPVYVNKKGQVVYASNINDDLVNAVMAKHYQYDWMSHALQVVRGCYVTWTDRNGVNHRIDGFDKFNLLERIKAL